MPHLHPAAQCVAAVRAVSQHVASCLALAMLLVVVSNNTDFDALKSEQYKLRSPRPSICQVSLHGVRFV